MSDKGETTRLLYHSRTLIVSVIGLAGIGVAVFLSGGSLADAVPQAYAMPLLGITVLVLAVFAWIGWTDYVSATSLAIDARGVSLGGRTIAWSEMRGVSRGMGAFRLVVRTDAGRVRFQLLVLKRPIEALKLLVSESTKAGAKVEQYLVRLAEHVEEDDE